MSWLANKNSTHQLFQKEDHQSKILHCTLPECTPFCILNKDNTHLRVNISQERVISIHIWNLISVCVCCSIIGDLRGSMFTDLSLFAIMSLSTHFSSLSHHSCLASNIGGLEAGGARMRPGQILGGKRIQDYSIKSFHKLHENKEYLGVTYPFGSSSILPHVGWISLHVTIGSLDFSYLPLSSTLYATSIICLEVRRMQKILSWMN